MKITIDSQDLSDQQYANLKKLLRLLDRAPEQIEIQVYKGASDFPFDGDFLRKLKVTEE
jgi:hypothetical protein